MASNMPYEQKCYYNAQGGYKFNDMLEVKLINAAEDWQVK